MWRCGHVHEDLVCEPLRSNCLPRGGPRRRRRGGVWSDGVHASAACQCVAYTHPDSGLPSPEFLNPVNRYESSPPRATHPRRLDDDDDDDPGAELARCRATHVTLTPSLWSLQRRSPLELPALRSVVLGGEPMAQVGSHPPFSRSACACAPLRSLAPARPYAPLCVSASVCAPLRSLAPARPYAPLCVSAPVCAPLRSLAPARPCAPLCVSASVCAPVRSLAPARRSRWCE